MKLQLRFTSSADEQSIAPDEKATSIVLNLSLLFGRVLRIRLHRQLSSAESNSNRVWTLHAQIARH